MNHDCCGGHEKHEHKASTASAETYTCPMHPEVQKDEPGSCPDCGMYLVPKSAEATGGHHKNEGAHKGGCCS
ncbi:MAG: hypothetical protein HYS26_01780 [Candidatus Kaiserbacteria bacterium]|nr:MAG: hypothetical protein HYS26_01780 [Candidatus Kaiserbacteria bacterium]